VCCATDISGYIQMDFKSDRISDFMVYYLSEKTGRYEKYMSIPLSAAHSNITDCMPWMVCCYLSLTARPHCLLLIAMADLSVRPSVRHVPLFCPDE